MDVPGLVRLDGESLGQIQIKQFQSLHSRISSCLFPHLVLGVLVLLEFIREGFGVFERRRGVEIGIGGSSGGEGGEERDSIGHLLNQGSSSGLQSRVQTLSTAHVIEQVLQFLVDFLHLPSDIRRNHDFTYLEHVASSIRVRKAHFIQRSS
jgi:hypothetical protein